MQANLFDNAAECLERNTDFDRLEARGTLRLALQQAGLNPKTLTHIELRVVFEKIMPSELKLRGIGNAAEICEGVLQELKSAPSSPVETPNSSIDDIFQRLGGGT